MPYFALNNEEKITRKDLPTERAIQHANYVGLAEGAKEKAISVGVGQAAKGDVVFSDSFGPCVAVAVRISSGKEYQNYLFHAFNAIQAQKEKESPYDLMIKEINEAKAKGESIEISIFAKTEGHIREKHMSKASLVKFDLMRRTGFELTPNLYETPNYRSIVVDQQGIVLSRNDVSSSPGEMPGETREVSKKVDDQFFMQQLADYASDSTGDTKFKSAIKKYQQMQQPQTQQAKAEEKKEEVVATPKEKMPTADAVSKQIDERTQAVSKKKFLFKATGEKYKKRNAVLNAYKMYMKSGDMPKVLKDIKPAELKKVLRPQDVALIDEANKVISEHARVHGEMEKVASSTLRGMAWEANTDENLQKLKETFTSLQNLSPKTMKGETLSSIYEDQANTIQTLIEAKGAPNKIYSEIRKYEDRQADKSGMSETEKQLVTRTEELIQKMKMEAESNLEAEKKQKKAEKKEEQPKEVKKDPPPHFKIDGVTHEVNMVLINVNVLNQKELSAEGPQGHMRKILDVINKAGGKFPLSEGDMEKVTSIAKKASEGLERQITKFSERKEIGVHKVRDLLSHPEEAKKFFIKHAVGTPEYKKEKETYQDFMKQVELQKSFSEVQRMKDEVGQAQASVLDKLQQDYKQEVAAAPKAASAEVKLQESKTEPKAKAPQPTELSSEQKLSSFINKNKNLMDKVQETKQMLADYKKENKLPAGYQDKDEFLKFIADTQKKSQTEYLKAKRELGTMCSADPALKNKTNPTEFKEWNASNRSIATDIELFEITKRIDSGMSDLRRTQKDFDNFINDGHSNSSMKYESAGEYLSALDGLNKKQTLNHQETQHQLEKFLQVHGSDPALKNQCDAVQDKLEEWRKRNENFRRVVKNTSEDLESKEVRTFRR